MPVVKLTAEESFCALALLDVPENGQQRDFVRVRAKIGLVEQLGQLFDLVRGAVLLHKLLERHVIPLEGMRREPWRVRWNLSMQQRMKEMHDFDQ